MGKIQISKLKSHPRNNYFFDDIGGDAWETFLNSIRTSGIIDPIVITDDNMIVSGHQRVRACKELDIHEIECFVNKYDSDDQLLKDLIETNICQRGVGNPNPIKLGRCIKELERIYGIRQGSSNEKGNNRIGESNIFTDQSSDPTTESEFAERLGISRQSLQNYKKLAELIPEFEDFLETGIISATTALGISRQLSIDDQKIFLSQLNKEAKYTRGEIQQRINKTQSSSRPLENNTTNEPEDSAKISTREKFEKNRADRLQAENERLRSEKATLSNEINQLRSEAESPDLSDYVTKSDYNKKCAEAEAAKKSIDELRAEYDEKIMRLKSTANSAMMQNADTAYDFWLAVDNFVKRVVAPLNYDEVISPSSPYQDSACGEYIERGCNLLIDAATDVLRRFKTQDVIDIY